MAPANSPFRKSRPRKSVGRRLLALSSHFDRRAAAYPLSPWGYGVHRSDSKGKYGFLHSEKTPHFQRYWGEYPQFYPAQSLLQPIDFSAFSNLFESRSSQRDRVRGYIAELGANRSIGFGITHAARPPCRNLYSRYCGPWRVRAVIVKAMRRSFAGYQAAFRLRSGAFR